MKHLLLSIILPSQDKGNGIAEQASDGRVSSVCDNIDRLLADCINNANESGDLETMLADLRYAHRQIKAAYEALHARTTEQAQPHGKPSKLVLVP